MPRYKYTAKDLDGKTIRGEAEAPGEDELYEQLREGNKYLVSCDEVTREHSERRMKADVLADFCRQLGTLLNAGVTLVRTLNIIAQEEGLNPKIKKVYNEILRQIRQGIPLSEAMEAQGNVFPDLLVHMMRSAEESGSIDQTALRMADHYDKEHRMNGKVKNAMIYPAILLFLLVVVMIFVMVYIIPQFKPIFDMLDEVPFITRIVLACSDAFINRWAVIVAVIVIAAFAVHLLLRLPKVRYGWDALKLKLPKVGKLLRVIYTARFARTLSSLYGSGIPMLLSLQIGRRTVGNRYIEAQFDAVIDQVRRGEPLSKALREVDGLELKLSSTILVGEETGSLENMLNSIAESLEFDADQALSKMVTMMEPVLIIIMGLVIGFVMIAVLLPIFQSYNAIETYGA
ncbi:type II secretion system F family protein [Diplocloster modestus]|uniref:Type II secretion system F family protein n=1 Tax=Diplocloster modestus TaxID=2850322 RepID=A0ABS6K4F5_9FIRM|nr:type II secretion system F family protein [Diplocloster modestus]MBU9725420.1 type II secretion system F family protein [Diplocloster modestus]